MTVSYPCDPALSMGLQIFRPSDGLYWSWWAGAWDPHGPESVLRRAPHPDAVPADLVVVDVPDAIAAGGDVVAQLVLLDGAGAPTLTYRAEVIDHAGTAAPQPLPRVQPL